MSKTMSPEDYQPKFVIEPDPQDPHATVLEVRRKTVWESLFWMLLALPLSGTAGLGFKEAFRDRAIERIEGKLFAGTLLACVLVLCLICAYAFLQTLFTRRLTISQPGGVCRLSHIPGLSRTFGLDEIEAIRIELSPGYRSGFIVRLTLPLKAKRRPAVVLEEGASRTILATTFEVFEERAAELSELLARQGQPVEVIVEKNHLAHIIHG